MGYACPVCDDPQADDVHLANHLAFTAMTGGDDHEAWLDERVPEWGQLGEDELSTEVVEYAEETEFPQVFEDTVDRSDDGHSHDHAHGHGHGDLPQGADRHRGSNALSDHDSEVLAEARDLTREMLRDSDDETDSDAGDSDTSESDAGDDTGANGDETE
ncbi:DUF5810 domain-containing protein [Haloarcula argentinensis]|uniref:DUF5810 domain-containing protein n=1 Tax=Haloarcula argentinensis TaxID=43776 RepID=A0A830FU83_HALAR|nr:DUF5810 domain-containing protein [Haloarcula argentinensis]EMA19672.1 hypothetical protein C443_15369 [Haloarcula argentinensis DSM 12282]MDS0254499.1 DUF5810 domain-containing protein [Haloarcula argentinensis]GGM41273.1 hypothetical protein GCM10009006_23080 [Haloarcula argentinensis]